MSRVHEFEQSLQRPARGRFGEDELDGLPESVARFFRVAIAPGTPLAQTARIAMRGRVKVKKWMRFAGTEVITPSAGFIWAVRAGPIRGYDRYADGQGEMRWQLLGLIPVMHATGPDIGRSAAGRIGGEGTWIPTALLPRFGVEWSAIDDTHLVCHHHIDDHRHDYHHILDERGRVATTWFERWGDPDGTGTYALHPFGVETRAHATFRGLTIPAAGRAGWHYGTGRWDDGIFFEYEITDVEPYP